MSLSLKAIDRIFDRLTTTYGRDFVSKFEGIDLNAVKSSWAHELAQFDGRLEMIGWALENLPERPPNVLQFRAICWLAPKPQELALPAPAKMDAEIVRQVAEGLKAKPMGTVDHKAWARKILKDKENGIVRTPTVVLFAKQALGLV